MRVSADSGMKPAAYSCQQAGVCPLHPVSARHRGFVADVCIHAIDWLQSVWVWVVVEQRAGGHLSAGHGAFDRRLTMILTDRRQDADRKHCRYW